MALTADTVLIDASGRSFNVPLSTIRKFPDTLLYNMFCKPENKPVLGVPSERGYLLDVDQEAFEVVVHYMRRGKLRIPLRLNPKTVEDTLEYLLLLEDDTREVQCYIGALAYISFVASDGKVFDDVQVEMLERHPETLLAKIAQKRGTPKPANCPSKEEKYYISENENGRYKLNVDNGVLSSILQWYKTGNLGSRPLLTTPQQFRKYLNDFEIPVPDEHKKPGTLEGTSINPEDAEELSEMVSQTLRRNAREFAGYIIATVSRLQLEKGYPKLALAFSDFNINFKSWKSVGLYESPEGIYLQHERTQICDLPPATSLIGPQGREILDEELNAIVSNKKKNPKYKFGIGSITEDYGNVDATTGKLTTIIHPRVSTLVVVVSLQIDSKPSKDLSAKNSKPSKDLPAKDSKPGKDLSAKEGEVKKKSKPFFLPPLSFLRDSSQRRK